MAKYFTPYLLILCCLLLAPILASPVPAAFDSETLVMSVYNDTTDTGDTEFGFDTGFDLSTVDWTQAFTYTVDTGLTLDYFAGSTTWADLRMGMYAYDRTSTTSSYGYAYITTTNEDTIVNGTQYTQVLSSYNTMKSSYSTIDTNDDGTALLGNNLSNTTEIAGETVDTTSYDTRMNNTNATSGWYGGFNSADYANGEADLSVLGDDDDSNDVITLYLHGYYRYGFSSYSGYDMDNGILTDDNGDAINWLAVITLDADGLLTICNSGDSDGDGYIDCIDNCPEDSSDDQTDTDGDGLGDVCDPCPEDPDLECEADDPCPGDTDNDADEVCDSADNCPGVYNPDQADWNADNEGDACDDSDDDGVNDDTDLCREDPLKTTHGQCGCGIRDIDADGDGTADCNDLCPADSAKIAPGECGCGAAESDDCDGDGYTNSQEESAGTDPNDDTSQPSRPTVAADDQTAYAGSDVTLTATATLGENPTSNAIDIFTWTQTEGEAVLGDDGEETTSPDADQPLISTLTFTAPELGQHDDPITLTFQLTVTDLAGIQSDPPVTITVTVQPTGDNNAPSQPSLSAPAIDSPDDYQITDLTDLVLVVNNPANLSTNDDGDAVDIDGDPVGIQFMFDKDGNNVLTGDAWFVFTEPADASASTTSWSYTDYDITEALEEDTHYYWSARACDDQGACSELMAVGDDEPYARFFVNQVNAAPQAPDLLSPGDGATVGTLTPTFEVDFNPYSDNTDYYDTHTYVLQIAGSADGLDDPEYSYTLLSCTAGTSCKETQTGYTIATGLTEGRTYYWRVQYSDDGGLGGHTDTRVFTVDATQSAPNTPTLLSPDSGATVSALPVTLSFRNNGDDDTADVDLIFTVELATDSAFSQNLQSVGSDSDPECFTADAEDETRFSVSFSGLTEDTTYYWRVTVSDGTSSVSGTRRSFFVNTDNAAPGAPAAVQPEDGAVWRTALKVPALIATGWSDSEGEDVYCAFELMTADDGATVAGTSDSGRVEAIMASGDAPPYRYTCSWELNGIYLDNGTDYQWQVTAYDGQDASAAASDTATFQFTTAVNFYQPTAPTLNNPYSGGTVQSLTPTLSVFLSSDDDENSLSYTFELYPCASLSCEPVALSDPVVGTRLVSVTPRAALTEGITYYWRVQAADETDERYASAWMPIASFTVDQSVDVPYQPDEYYVSAIAKYNCDEDSCRIFTVTGSEAGDMAGVTVTIPSGALTATTGDINLQVASVTAAPALPVDKAAVGEVIFLAPENFEFAGTVTVDIPVVSPGDEDPAGLQVLTYDTTAGEWVQVASTLSDDKQSVQIEVTHFCIYTLALEDTSAQSDSETDTGGGGSSGLGGCFIDTLAESSK